MCLWEAGGLVGVLRRQLSCGLCGALSPCLLFWNVDDEFNWRFFGVYEAAGDVDNCGLYSVGGICCCERSFGFIFGVN